MENKKMDILIFAGQSNMEGSTGEKCAEPPVEGAFEYRYLTNELKELKNPVGENINGGVLTQSELGNGSLVPFFCKEYKKRTNNRVTAIHIAKGGSSIESWLPETERFKIATTKVLNGIKKVQESFVVEKIYFIWLQGESDAIKRTGTDIYKKMLIKFKNALKETVKIDKFAIIQQGYFSEFAGWVEGSKEEKRKHDEEIMEAFSLAEKEDKDFIILTKICVKLSREQKWLNPKEYGPHFNNAAMAIIGEKAGNALALYRNKNN